MEKIIQIRVYKGENNYVAEGVNFPIVTQGKTLDELFSNVKEAVDLHLADERLEDINLDSHPSVVINFELPRAIHA